MEFDRSQNASNDQRRGAKEGGRLRGSGSSSVDPSRITFNQQTSDHNRQNRLLLPTFDGSVNTAANSCYTPSNSAWTPQSSDQGILLAVDDLSNIDYAESAAGPPQSNSYHFPDGYHESMAAYHGPECFETLPTSESTRSPQPVGRSGDGGTSSHTEEMDWTDDYFWNTQDHGEIQILK